MKKALIIATIGGFLPVSEINNAILLQELGFEVHYAANMTNRIYEFEEQELIDKGIKLHHVEFSKNPFNMIKLTKCIKNVKKIIEDEQIQVVHCHTPVAGVAGRIAAHFSKIVFSNNRNDQIKTKVSKKCRPYVIYTAHGFHFYKGAPVFNWICYYPVEYLLSAWTDCLITINQEDEKRAKKMRCKRCVKIPGVGIDLNRFSPVKNTQQIRSESKDREWIQQKKTNLENMEIEKFHIISVGELNKNKNHRIVIEAMALLKDKTITYEIYGNGNGKHQLETYIRFSGLESQVHLRGFDMEIEKQLQQADCCIFPSFREGLGLAALEAMACKVPLIVSDNRGVREFAEHNKNCIAIYTES